MRRREFIPVLAAPLVLTGQLNAKMEAPNAKLKSRIKQGITKDVFGSAFGQAEMSVEDMCREAARLGITGFDFAAPEDWPTLKKYGITPAMHVAQAGSISDGINRVENHATIEAAMRRAIEESAAAGCPNVIAFSGNRRGQDDRLGADNTVAFLNRIKSHAEDKGVTITIAVLNSKVDHKDYQFDKIEWGADVIKRVDSPRVKILFDIHHVQIMQGDIVRRIRDNFQHIAHFHTGHIDAMQELNYGYIMRQIAELGFTGYVTHAYSPAATIHDPLKTLESAIQICGV